jgi:mono/diheme cytochrome c family protein
MNARSLLLVLLLTAGLPFAWPSGLSAHEIPRQTLVQAIVKPDRQRLHLLVRVPLDAMRDVEFPTRGAGYLDVARSDTLLRDAARLWVADGVTMFENGERLPAPRIVVARASLPTDGAFASYAAAIAHVTGPALSDSIELPWAQGMLDVLLEYDITSDSADFSIQPAYAGLGIRTNTVVRFLQRDGAERTFMFAGNPGRVALDPGPFDAASRFVRLGFTHILDGIDHLLFLFCLVLPFRALRPLIALVTSFTIAHSITLFASAFGFAPDALWFPPLVESLIALSIVYMACENMLGANLERRWIVAFGFGLVHGFGFSFALRESLQFAGSHLVTSLAAFNVGVELGQVAVLAVAVPVLALLFRRVPERAGILLLSAFVAHTAWHWTTERGSALLQYRFEWPAMDVLLLASAMRAAMVLIVIGAAGWLLHGVLGRWTARPTAVSPAGITPAGASTAGIATTAASLLFALLLGAAVVALPRTSEAQTRPKPATQTASKPVAKKPAARLPARRLSGRSTMLGVYTAEQAKQGREVFTGTCTGCHTPASHTGAVFNSKWLGRTVNDLFTYIQNSMPKIAPGSLSEEEYLWVTTYLLKLNGMPPGPTELSPEPAVMKALRIDTTHIAPGRE